MCALLESLFLLLAVTWLEPQEITAHYHHLAKLESNWARAYLLLVTTHCRALLSSPCFVCHVRYDCYDGIAPEKA